MRPRAWISSFVVVVLAGHAYGQPSGPQATSPPSADTTTAAGATGSAAPVQGHPSPPPSPSSPPPPPQPPPEKPERHALCFAGRPFECASVLLLEIGARVGNRGRSVASADLGLLIHDGLNAYGATIGVVGISGGNAKEEASLWYAARYRRYFGRWGLAGDVSVGFAGGPALEVAFGWSDVVALTAGVNRYELKDGGHDMVAGVGLRVGSVPIGGLFYLTVLVFTSAR